MNKLTPVPSFFFFLFFQSSAYKEQIERKDFSLRYILGLKGKILTVMCSSLDGFPYTYAHGVSHAFLAQTAVETLETFLCDLFSLKTQLILNLRILSLEVKEIKCFLHLTKIYSTGECDEKCHLSCCISKHLAKYDINFRKVLLFSSVYGEHSISEGIVCDKG